MYTQHKLESKQALINLMVSPFFHRALHFTTTLRKISAKLFQVLQIPPRVRAVHVSTLCLGSRLGCFKNQLGSCGFW